MEGGEASPPSDEHSSDTARGRMELSRSSPYSIGSKRTTTSKSATKIGLATKQGNKEEEEEVPQVCLPVPAPVGQAGAAEHSFLLFHWAELLLDVMLN